LRVELLEGRSVPATITPTTFADGGLGSGSLRDAVLQLNADTGTEDDIIQLLPGTYSLTIQNVGNRHETAGLTGDLDLTQTSHRWIIQGAGLSTIIDASQLADRVFQIVNPGTQVVFQDMVIQGGLAQDDSSDGALAGTTAGLGGGIFNNGGYLTLDNVVLQNNVARGGDGPRRQPGYNALGGGLFSSGGALTMSASTLANNQANGGVGGPDFYFPGRGGDAQGGGLYVDSGTVTISDSTITANTLHGGRSGGVSANGGATYGGGLFAGAATVTISDSNLANNQAVGGDSTRGGTTFCIDTCGARDGGTSQGGGLYIGRGMLTISDSTIAANILRGGTSNGVNGDGGPTQGGGLYADDVTVTISNSMITSNTSRGGIGDTAGASHGAGLYVAGMLTVSTSTIASNTSRGGDARDSYYDTRGAGGEGLGGGLWVASGATARVSFSTIAANQAMGGTGGGLRGTDGPATGGGLYNQGTLQTGDTILAGSSVTGPGTDTSPDLAGNLGSLGYNLIGNTQGSSGFDATDLLNVNPLLGPLQDNGGPTQTMALLPGSPAIDAGDNTDAPLWDQRGAPFRRVVNGVIDIGAFEVQARGYGRPSRQPLPDPVPVQALGMPAGPLFGQPPALPAASYPLLGSGAPTEQVGQPGADPVPQAGGQQAPDSFTADASDGQPGDPVGLRSTIPAELPAFGFAG
jgi:hypothetical protein